MLPNEKRKSLRRRSRNRKKTSLKSGQRGMKALFNENPVAEEKYDEKGQETDASQLNRTDDVLTFSDDFLNKRTPMLITSQSRIVGLTL